MSSSCKRSQLEVLNTVYKSLNTYKTDLINALNARGYSYKWGYYSGHYMRCDEKWMLEQFPIPVITVKGLCDIGMDLSHIFIESRLQREQALQFDFTILQKYKFEVYGTADYLNDFYNEDQDLGGIRERILDSMEQEIGISLLISYEECIDHIVLGLETLRNLGFYM
ncbi:MAG: DUF3201 domain-containing protein [Cellulosilyticaceae bacterium]